MEHQSHEIEAKFLQESFEHFPPDALEALRRGERHPMISRWDFVQQLYVPPDDQNILDQVVKEVNKAGIPFGTLKEQAELAQVGRAQELRILLERNFGICQLTIKGQPDNEGLSCAQLETPWDQIISEQVTDIVKELGLKDLARGWVSKLWHDFKVDIGGKERVLEHDILLSHGNLMVVETEVELSNPQDAVTEIRRLLQKRLFPPYFGRPLHGRPEMKNRRVAFTPLYRLPADIRESLGRRSSEDMQTLQDIIQAKTKLSAPLEGWMREV